MVNISSEIEAFLRQPNVAVLATVNRDGTPHAAPVWYLYDNGEFIVYTGGSSRKFRNIQRRSDVTLVIDRRDLPYYVITVVGRAESADGVAQSTRERLAKHYLGEQAGTRYVRENPGDGSVPLRILPTAILEYKGSASRD